MDSDIHNLLIYYKFDLYSNNTVLELVTGTGFDLQNYFQVKEVQELVLCDYKQYYDAKRDYLPAIFAKCVWE